MVSKALSEAALGLLGICIVAGALDSVIHEKGAAFSFRALCALAIALRLLRLILRLLGAVPG